MIACKQISDLLCFYAAKVARTRIPAGNSSAAENLRRNFQVAQCNVSHNKFR